MAFAGGCAISYALAMRLLRRLFILTLCLTSLSAAAEEEDRIAMPEKSGGNMFFKLATGGLSGNYYPLGGLIAQSLSQPINGRRCAEGGACGVPGLVVYPLSANASLSNMAALDNGTIDAAIVQSDAAFWGYTGTSLFNTPHTNVRFIATLFTENLYLIARKDSNIKTVADLRGHLVSVGLNGSGTLENARAVLSAAGMGINEIVPQYLTYDEGLKRLRKGLVTALFFVSAADNVADILGKDLIPVPIDGALRQTILDRFLFFDKVTLPAKSYGGSKPWQTVGLGAQLLVRADLPDKLIYDITTTLWSPHAQTLLALHPKGQQVRTDTAFFGLSVPMHTGAARYYREQGITPKRLGSH